jgi:hypothetical protein
MHSHKDRQRPPRQPSAPLSRTVRIMSANAISILTLLKCCTSFLRVHLNLRDQRVHWVSLQIASVIYEHENDAVRAAVAITASEKPTSSTPTLAAASAELLTHLNPVTHVPGDLLKDLFTDETAAAASKSLDSAGDHAIRDFCRRFGIDFEPVSGTY